MQANTYSREMMDGKLQVITDELKKHDEDLKGIHQLIGNSGRELMTRVATVLGIGYTLILLLPHLTKGLDFESNLPRSCYAACRRRPLQGILPVDTTAPAARLRRLRP